MIHLRDPLKLKYRSGPLNYIYFVCRDVTVCTYLSSDVARETAGVHSRLLTWLALPDFFIDDIRFVGEMLL